MKLKFKRLHKNTAAPQYLTDGSVGFDLSLPKDTTFPPGKPITVGTGLVIKPPDGYWIQLVPRSSLFKKHGLIMPHSVGIVDSDYCGDKDEIKLQLFNLLRTPQKIKARTRIAQGILTKKNVFEIEEVEEELASESRGGFGSSGED